MLDLNESTFKDTINNKQTVVVDFWTSWCPPCRALAPKFKEWGDRYSDKATFAKVNVDDTGALSLEYKISAIPTVIVFSGGNEVKRWVGLPPEKELVETLESESF